MQCPRCQQDAPSDAEFCPECGTKLGAVCAQCGTANASGHKFCKRCGQPLTSAVEARPEGGRFGSPESYTPKHLVEKILTSKAALEGERKQVTVLFADLKGSMELLADRDPEEARKLLDPVLEHMMEAVHRYEGTVNQVMGDGIMALFGAPLTHEDHAVRACYAALRMQESVKKYAEGIWRSEGVRIQIRVGLNAGEVVVRSIGSDLHMDYTAVGQTTHLAARMEQTANPGTILLTADALRLAEGFVQVQPLGPTPVKGLNVPIEVYELTGASPVRSRLQAAAARGLTTFVGRDPEMDTLLTALEQAKAGKGQLVAVVGEPGVGKSRLFWEFAHSHRSQGCLVLETTSVSYGKATTYLPVIDLLKGYFQIEPRDDARKIREKLTGKLLSLDRTLERCLAPLLWLLDVPAEDPEWERLDPPLRRQRLLESLRQLILRESQVQPLVLVFEDLHWIDAETQAVLDQFMESLPPARLLFLVNYRPEYRHGWGSKTYYRQLRIDPLSAASAEQLLGTLLGDDPSVAALKWLLVARTEGNPLFLEESVRSLVETDILAGARGAYRMPKPAEALQIPATTQVILAARIDRISPEDKRLLQTASVIGKNLPYRLLHAIADLDEPTLRAGLARLQGAEFLYEIQLFPDAEYTFKHALTHEVAYGTLLADRRRTLHAALVEAIERVYPGRLDEHLERLAHHAHRGEVWQKAVTYARQAGARAAASSAYPAAAALFEAALAAVHHLAQTRETQALSVDLMLGLRVVYLALGEPDRSLDLAQRTRTIAEALGDDQRRLNATAHLVNARYLAGDAAGAVTLGEQVLADAERQAAGQVHFRTSLGQAHIALGDYRRAIALLERNSEATFGASATPWGFLPPLISQGWLATSLAEVGSFSQALAIAQNGAHLAQTFSLYERLYFVFGLTAPAFLRGDHETAIPQLEQALALVRELNLLAWLPGFAALLGYTYAHTGRLAEGLRLLEEATIQSETRNRVRRAFYLALQSDALRLAGQVRDARSAALRGLEGAHTRGERGDEAHCLRALGEAEASGDSPDLGAARTHLQDALVLAEELGMRPLVAHCHFGLGKLYRRIDQRDQAREHLTIATTLYREMDMPFWLKQAEAEMRALAG